MPNQFTQEYIAYILSDEAKGLQEKLTIQFGTQGIVSLCGGERIALVTEIEHDPDAACDFYGIFEGSGRSTSFGRREVTIIPNLGNLLQIIEGAGYDWQRDITGQWTIFKPPESLYKERANRGRDTLAAAKLAVKALGNTNHE